MSIKLWKEDDRPREKFYHKGKSAVSDSELLAILIGMGTREKSALDIAKDMLSDNENSLEKLSKLSVKELTKYKGIGEAKAITIAAALELGNRKHAEPNNEIQSIVSSNDTFNLLRPYYAGLKQEEFYVILLNKALKPIKIQRISIGKTDATLVDIKIIAKLALEYLASQVVIAHNHPSGNLKPSDADIKLTTAIKSGLNLLEIKLLDHIIMAEDKYLSFADEEIL
ncbi:MAG: DNA repair protein RadC [Chitinophagales bacterium]|nr:DNA repair protein RadC [Chitinophagales bacterium]